MERKILGGRRSRRTWQRTHKTQRAIGRITLLCAPKDVNGDESQELEEKTTPAGHPKIDNSAAAALPRDCRGRRWRWLRRQSRRHRVVARSYMCTHVGIFSQPFLCSYSYAAIFSFRSPISLLCGWLSIRWFDYMPKSFSHLSVLCCRSCHSSERTCVLGGTRANGVAEKIIQAAERVQLSNRTDTIFRCMSNTIGISSSHTAQPHSEFGPK